LSAELTKTHSFRLPTIYNNILSTVRLAMHAKRIWEGLSNQTNLLYKQLHIKCVIFSRKGEMQHKITQFSFRTHKVNHNQNSPVAANIIYKKSSTCMRALAKKTVKSILLSSTPHNLSSYLI